MTRASLRQRRQAENKSHSIITITITITTTTTAITALSHRVTCIVITTIIITITITADLGFIFVSGATYCKMMDLSWQMNDAAREKVQKRKAKTLSQEIVQLGKRLPEFVVLSEILEQLDLNSPGGREIALIIQGLNQSCPE